MPLVSDHRSCQGLHQPDHEAYLRSHPAGPGRPGRGADRAGRRAGSSTGRPAAVRQQAAEARAAHGFLLHRAPMVPQPLTRQQLDPAAPTGRQRHARSYTHLRGLTSSPDCRPARTPQFVQRGAARFRRARFLTKLARASSTLFKMFLCRRSPISFSRPRPGEASRFTTRWSAGHGLLRRDGSDSHGSVAGREDYTGARVGGLLLQQRLRYRQSPFLWTSFAKLDDCWPGCVEKGWLVTEVKPREVEDWVKEPRGVRSRPFHCPCNRSPNGSRPGLGEEGHARHTFSASGFTSTSLVVRPLPFPPASSGAGSLIQPTDLVKVFLRIETGELLA